MSVSRIERSGTFLNYLLALFLADRSSCVRNSNKNLLRTRSLMVKPMLLFL